jgi:hypothetical protein
MFPGIRLEGSDLSTEAMVVRVRLPQSVLDRPRRDYTRLYRSRGIYERKL